MNHADHQEYTYQATLFYNSMSDAEKTNMISAAQFELSKCEEHIVHQNAISRFNEIDHDFALAVAEVFPAVKVPDAVKPNHGQRSDFLSQVTGKNQGGCLLTLLICTSADQQSSLPKAERSVSTSYQDSSTPPSLPCKRNSWLQV